MQCGRLKQPKEGDSKENFIQKQSVRGREFYLNYMTKKCQVYTYTACSNKFSINEGYKKKYQPFSILVLHALLFVMPSYPDE